MKALGSLSGFQTSVGRLLSLMAVRKELAGTGTQGLDVVSAWWAVESAHLLWFHVPRKTTLR